MAAENGTVGTHVGDALSGYVDGELTQQERQRVELHCARCAECREDMARLRELRERVGGAQLGEFGEDVWRESMNDPVVRSASGIGWTLVIGAVLVGGALLCYAAFRDLGDAPVVRLAIIAGYVGLAALFVAVLRQRLIERRRDKYEDVEI